MVRLLFSLINWCLLYCYSFAVDLRFVVYYCCLIVILCLELLGLVGFVCVCLWVWVLLLGFVLGYCGVDSCYCYVFVCLFISVLDLGLL